ncbi:MULTISPECIES: hypothetical protein [Halobacterium]|uniref:Uncharacterized protein n=3 Tax=Halobacterium salinarum TaxID=2242 RepID=Q9HN09_HALSA|nr:MULTISPECIES: hypothetical protein [Halobacterium]AAG20412.1 hypothetical protein VNG_2299H [Halobacterium salinarum NRC-1]MBB6089661.1 hypothetical protein [Halobacterium salinarum]MCF2164411.1 hypothetical protein [Halobacterium salinarum]MCF2167198.1 hypothetical protein [Halobacterium salinarum]MCF2238462.1 hypothetical protein [Halobacterium salinarum]
MRTRRQFLATTTSLTTVGLLAGCARSPDNTDERGAENTYTASIAPVGDVAFDGELFDRQRVADIVAGAI